MRAMVHEDWVTLQHCGPFTMVMEALTNMLQEYGRSLDFWSLFSAGKV
jgi:hypothetical protein